MMHFCDEKLQYPPGSLRVIGIFGWRADYTASKPTSFIAKSRPPKSYTQHIMQFDFFFLRNTFFFWDRLFIFHLKAGA